MDSFREVVRYEVFTEAARLVRKGWVQGKLAVNAQGRQVYFGDEDAVAFDALGAIEHAAGDMAHSERAQAEHYLGLWDLGTLSQFNDAVNDVELVACFLEFMAEADYVNPYPVKCGPYEKCT
jgi:hypothetical protein